MSQDFLFEIGTEELPAKQLSGLAAAFKKNVLDQLEKFQLSYLGEAKIFVTPRRLAISIPQLAAAQLDQTIERKGPSIQSAFDAGGKPTKACEGFAKSCGVSVKELESRETPQGKWLFAIQHIKGKSAAELLPIIVQEALDKLPISKPMHWGENTKAFLRPVRWVLMLLGSKVVPGSFFGQDTSHLTYGHRFLTQAPIAIKKADQYEEILSSQGKVVADFERRRELIREQLTRAAHALHAEVCLNEALLTEVTGLVEWPHVLTASFDPRFLNIPENALIAAMEGHQKSFAVKKAGKLLPHFLTTTNILSKDEKIVIAGNERVMRARLSDAEFFYQQDLRIPLENYAEDLKKVIFQIQLGSLYAKSQALASFSKVLAVQLKFDQDLVEQAACLAKCDLRTQMVGEFPELQGEMGQIYAKKQGLAPEIADALLEQYLPRFANDILPSTPTGITLALADRLLNLVGIFGIGQIPTGEKDPFGLRRAAIGVCRIILDKQLNLALKSLLREAQLAWQERGTQFAATNVVSEVHAFLMERVRYMYVEEGIRPQIIQAVMALQLDNLLDIHARIQAVNLFQALPESASLIAAQKRVMNLLQKEKCLPEALEAPQAQLFELPQEKALADALMVVSAHTKENIHQRNYAEALQHIAKLKQPVDDFFDHVMVMVDDTKLRHNRLCLLASLFKFMNEVANISYL